MSRPWVKLDATYVEDDKVMAAGALAELVFVRSIAYCRRRFTDGVIKPAAIPSLTLGVPEDSATLVEALVTNRLWAVHPDGWVVVNYEAWQLTTEKLAAEAERKRADREKRKDRQRPNPSSGRPSDAGRTSDGHALTLVPGDFDEPDDITPLLADVRASLKATHA